MSKDFMVDHAMKAQAWEEAKGKLRALVALQGSYAAGSSDAQNWAPLSGKVEAFIADVEGNALQE